MPPFGPVRRCPSMSSGWSDLRCFSRGEGGRETGGTTMNRRELIAVVALGVALASGPALSAQNAAPAPVRIALVGGSLIDGNGGAAVADAVVLVEGDKIQAVGK